MTTETKPSATPLLDYYTAEVQPLLDKANELLAAKGIQYLQVAQLDTQSDEDGGRTSYMSSINISDQATRALQYVTSVAVRNLVQPEEGSDAHNALSAMEHNVGAMAMQEMIRRIIGSGGSTEDEESDSDLVVGDSEDFQLDEEDEDDDNED